VHKVAKATTITLAVFILAATGFAEIRYRRQFGIERATYFQKLAITNFVLV